MIGSQSGYWGHFKGWHYPKMWLFWKVMIPVLTPLFGYFPSKKLGLFENLPKNMVYQWALWGRKKDYMMHYYVEREYYFNMISVPLFSLSFPKDHFAPKEAVDWLSDQFTKAHITRFHYPEKGPQPHHFGYFREKFKDPLWTMTDEWIGMTSKMKSD
jgi:predicted alpha/beta hydrolase